MPLNQQSPRPPKPVLAANFVASLHRLMRQSAYYNKGHKLVAASAEVFRRDLRLLSEAGETARFRNQDGKLLLADEEMPADDTFARDFRKLMDDLGIVELEITAQARPSEVMEFFRALQATYLRLRSARGFTSAPELDFVPPTIVITRKRYLEYETVSDGDQQVTFSMLIDRLHAKGLSDVRLQRCREVLDSLALLFRDQERRLRGHQLPQISWEDIERLLIRVSVAETPMFPGGGDAAKYPDSIADLAAILGALDPDLYAKQSHSAIDLMLLQVKRLYEDVVPDDLPKVATSRTDPRPRQDGLTEINEFLGAHPFDAALQKEVRQKPRQESLSIFMQLLQREHSPEGQATLNQCLFDFFSQSPPITGDWRILCAGFCEILAASPQREVGIAAQVLLAALNAQVGQSLNLLFFRDVLREAGELAVEKIWPYVLNEVAISARLDNKNIVIDLLDKLIRLPALARERWLPFMEGLSCCVNKRISPELIQIMEGRHYPLLALLIGSSLRQVIHEQVFLTFSQKPPDWLAQAVSPFLNAKDPLHLEFVRLYLRHGQINQPSRALMAMAGNILANGLINLSEDRRREPHVAPTIRILHLFRNPEIEALLKQITGGKKMLFLRQWPTECRQAALEALAQSE